MPKQDDLQPTILVIFGITGDLSQRYLLPSLYHLIKDNRLHPKTQIIGVTRGEMTSQQLLDKVELCVNEIDKVCDPDVLKSMYQRTSMFRMDLEHADDYAGLLAKLNQVEDEQGICMNRIYYLSIPPTAYSSVIKLMGEKGLNTSCPHGKATTRLMVEKPFGYDLESAQQLIDQTAAVFKEEQIFRIDHYMAKETVQDILTFRFRNPIFESIWDNQHIAGIEIRAREALGIVGRAVFYEPLGALRDFIQSHLLQILGIVTMDQPEALDSQKIHAQKQAVLQQVQPVSDVAKQAIRGQYEGYRQEVGNPQSTTETFAAVTVFIDSPRWQGVPIKMLTGKALNERQTEVLVNFKSKEGEVGNRLRFRVQPNEGIELELITKKPGYDYETQITVMDFSYSNNFSDYDRPEAYEYVLVDAIRGDQTLFATSQEVLAGWRILQPVLDAWSNNDADLTIYQPGSKGPQT